MAGKEQRSVWQDGEILMDGRRRAMEHVLLHAPFQPVPFVSTRTNRFLTTVFCYGEFYEGRLGNERFHEDVDHYQTAWKL
jgi:hypothetical protein